MEQGKKMYGSNWIYYTMDTKPDYMKERPKKKKKKDKKKKKEEADEEDDNDGFEDEFAMIEENTKKVI